MKKKIVLFASIALISINTFADKKDKKTAVEQKISETQKIVSKAPPLPAPTVQPSNATPNAGASNMNPEAMKFGKEEHSFGTVPEGPSVSYDFEFKNTGKEPIILSSVTASCGCTTPSWSKEPILPGKSSKITATYSTQGRPNSFTKMITVNSNIGTKTLKISGNVEPAPSSSVPSSTNSMMKH
jgi:hypothetical protein